MATTEIDKLNLWNLYCAILLMRFHEEGTRTILSSHQRLLMRGVVNSVESIHRVCMCPSPVISAITTDKREPM